MDKQNAKNITLALCEVEDMKEQVNWIEDCIDGLQQLLEDLSLEQMNPRAGSRLNAVRAVVSEIQTKTMAMDQNLGRYLQE